MPDEFDIDKQIEALSETVLRDCLQTIFDRTVAMSRAARQNGLEEEQLALDGAIKMMKQVVGERVQESSDAPQLHGGQSPAAQ